MTHKDLFILGIESSCDDTGAAVLKNNSILSNVVANQQVHEEFGGVVPELASRAHQKNVIPVVDTALKRAGVTLDQIDAIAYTRGPGLMGSLVVGTAFAKSVAMAKNIPLLAVNHMQGHVLAHFIEAENQEAPEFPFLCLTVSGGHTQIVKVTGPLDMEVLGQTLDDAAGEAFDKTAKLLGLPYPGGPLIDKHAKNGNPLAFEFTKPSIKGLDFSFSGLKTNVLQFLQKEVRKDPDFIDKNIDDLCASLQRTIIDILLEKLSYAAEWEQISNIAIAGGVSANSGLRKALEDKAVELGWKVHIPLFQFCTDNAAMIAITGKYMLESGMTAGQEVAAIPRWKLGKQNNQ